MHAMNQSGPYHENSTTDRKLDIYRLSEGRLGENYVQKLWEIFLSGKHSYREILLYLKLWM
jgi:hypothetical protein